MTIEVLTPTSWADWLEGRKLSVGASEVPALLGVHPWLTGFELWARKTGRLTDDSDSPAMRRGRLLEEVACKVIAEERPDWCLRPNPIPGGFHYRDTEARLSCTPDLFAENRDNWDDVANVQIKSVHAQAFRKEWRSESGQIEPPMYAVVQSLIEAHLTGSSRAYVAALVVDYGVDIHIVEVPMHPGVIARAYEAVRMFWAMVEEGREPDADYARDGEAIAKIYARDDGDEIDLSHSDRVLKLVAARQGLKAAMKQAKKDIEPIEAEIKAALGNHSSGRLVDGRVVSWRVTDRKGYEVKPTSFRVLRVSGEKE